MRPPHPPPMIVAATLALVLAGAASPASDTPGVSAEGSERVWCVDRRRAIVRHQARWQCEWEIVTEEEARRVEQARIDRIKRVLERQREPLVPGRRLTGSGTGFYVSDDGLMLTNAHVVRECDAVTVAPAGGEEFIAEVRALDPGRDLALLRTDRAAPGIAGFRDFDEPIGSEPVTVVGYPLHGKVVIKPRLVTGIVSPDARPRNPNVFAMKVDIRRGNSGGPVLDDAGRVMGVVFAKVDTPAVYAKTGKLIRDLGLALRLHVVRDFLRSQRVEMTTAGETAALEQHDRLERAREFIAQVGCWR